ncbi:hypothetical protein B0H14DRAFT_2598224 [Mycena olivaceomarginata]|nr:hypothetical protein B0H14DRAFT_2598224 [Mycena olivaceomarginata]
MFFNNSGQATANGGDDTVIPAAVHNEDTDKERGEVESDEEVIIGASKLAVSAALRWAASYTFTPQEDVSTAAIKTNITQLFKLWDMGVTLTIATTCPTLAANQLPPPPLPFPNQPLPLPMPAARAKVINSSQNEVDVLFKISAYLLVKLGEQPVEISDMTVRLVLGEANTDGWNHARFLPTLNLIYCVHGAEGHCVKPACRKSVWHENLTCLQYQVLPMTERMPEDMVFATLAEQEKWRQCPKCSVMVELKHHGSNLLSTPQQKSLCRKMRQSKSQYGKGAEAENMQLTYTAPIHFGIVSVGKDLKMLGRAEVMTRQQRKALAEQSTGYPDHMYWCSIFCLSSMPSSSGSHAFWNDSRTCAVEEGVGRLVDQRKKLLSGPLVLKLLLKWDLDSNSSERQMWEKERGNNPLSVIVREFILQLGWLKHILSCHQSPWEQNTNRNIHCVPRPHASKIKRGHITLTLGFKLENRKRRSSHLNSGDLDPSRVSPLALTPVRILGDHAQGVSMGSMGERKDEQPPNECTHQHQTTHCIFSLSHLPSRTHRPISLSRTLSMNVTPPKSCTQSNSPVWKKGLPYGPSSLSSCSSSSPPHLPHLEVCVCVDCVHIRIHGRAGKVVQRTTPEWDSDAVAEDKTEIKGGVNTRRSLNGLTAVMVLTPLAVLPQGLGGVIVWPLPFSSPMYTSARGTHIVIGSEESGRGNGFPYSDFTRLAAYQKFGMNFPPPSTTHQPTKVTEY